MNLKKYISIFLAILMLVSNFGFAINVHYCEDKVSSVTVGSSGNNAEEECCGVIEKESKCCHDKIVKSDEKSDQILGKSQTFEAIYIPVVHDWNPIFFSFNIKTPKREAITYYCEANAPPLYLLYRQFTFYA